MTPSSSHPLQPPPKVLLFAAEPVAGIVAREMTARLGATVTTVETQAHCQEHLGRETYDLVLLEETIALNHPALYEALQEMAGGSMLLELNFGLLNAERVAQQARAALKKQLRLERNALAKVRLSLRNELGASLSGLLLESQLALRTARPEIMPALQHMVTLAEALSKQLRA